MDEEDDKDEEIGLSVVTLRDLEVSALGGDPSAAHMLGVCCYRGWEVDLDLAMAFKWFLMAADKNDGPCMCQVAYMLERGEGCEADPAGAAEWYAKAAKRGFHGPEARTDAHCWDVDAELGRGAPEEPPVHEPGTPEEPKPGAGS